MSDRLEAEAKLKDEKLSPSVEETIDQRNNRYIAMQWMIKGAMIVLGCNKEEAKKKLDEAAMRDKRG